MVRFAYTQFAPGADERVGLEAILRENREKGYIYLSDEATRPAGAAHPLAAMWDNGGDPVAELGHELEVRRIALRRFGERNIPAGTPLGSLAEVLAPLYFHHRYQLEATAKSIGGLEYSYAVRGDGSPPARPVAADRQRAALAAVLGTLDPALLDLPEPVLGLLPPRSVDYPPHREFFGSRTSPAFDALGAAGSAADMTVSMLLPPERLARLIDFHRRDPNMPGADEVLDALRQRVFGGPGPAAPRLREIRRTVQQATVRRLLMAVVSPAQTPAARASLEASLRSLRAALNQLDRGRDPADLASDAMLAADIERVLARPAAAAPAPGAAPGAPPELPPGPPIGMWSADDGCGWR